LDQREKELIQENTRIKQQLAAPQEEKKMLLGRLHEIENQLNAVASNLPPSTDRRLQIVDASGLQDLLLVLRMSETYLAQQCRPKSSSG